MCQFPSTRIPIVVLPAILMLAAAALGDTFIVPIDHDSIQEAIDACNMSGDEIIVAPGTYPEAINFSGKAIYLHSSGGPDVTLIDASGLNSSAVRCVNGEGPNTILEGFIITGGYGLSGGGMYNDNTSPTVTNCRFSGNSASLGGGMYNYNASPTVTNCRFSENTAYDGGGMWNFGASPTVTNCTFSENTAFAYGSGMCNFDASPTVTNCTFSGNTALLGGGMCNFDAGPTVINCTFSGNSAVVDGGGMLNLISSPTLTNCILWGNTGGAIIGGSPTVTYSHVQGGYEGAGNSAADPMFVRDPDAGDDGEWGTQDDDYGDLHLRTGSPCIDAGDNIAFLTIALDHGGFMPPGEFDGWARFLDDPATADTGNGCGAIIDRGACEFQVFQPADINHDGVVDATDLAALLSAWGS